MIAYHGTFHRIDAWQLPEAWQRQSRGPAAICLSPSLEVARQYCDGLPGHPGLVRLYAERDDIRLNWIDDAGRDLPGRLEALARVEAEIERVRREWDQAGNPVEARVYRCRLTPRNPLHYAAGGRPHYNVDGGAYGQSLDIWALARQAQAAGHDCLIVDNVIDRGRHDAPDTPATTVFVFAVEILGAPELIEEEVRYGRRTVPA